jgi:hypothetical protein
MVMTYRYMVSLCSAGLDKIKHYDCIYGNDRCSRPVDPVLNCHPKLVAINEETNHEIVHGRRFGEANGAAHQTLNPGP